MQNNTKILGFFCFMLLCSSCYKESAVPVDEVIIGMTGNQASIPADGVSKQLITIEVPATISDAGNLIVLTTTKGTFEVAGKNTTTVSAQNVMINGSLHKVASVSLVSTTEAGVAYVTAAIKNYSKTDTVHFTNAYPDQVKVQVDKLNYQVSNTGELTVTIKISRSPGKGNPTSYQAATLSALDSTGQPVGRFRNYNAMTDAAGNCLNYFSIPTSNPYTGRVKLIATVPADEAGRMITDSATVIAY